MVKNRPTLLLDDQSNYPLFIYVRDAHIATDLVDRKVCTQEEINYILDIVGCSDVDDQNPDHREVLLSVAEAIDNNLDAWSFSDWHYSQYMSKEPWEDA